MHGVDWAAMRENYEPLLANIGDSDELRNMIMQMIGELNASHTGVSAAPPETPITHRPAIPASNSSRIVRAATRSPSFTGRAGGSRLRQDRARQLRSSP